MMKKTVLAVVLEVIALSTFLLDFQKYKFTPPAFWISSVVLYFVTVPLIAVSGSLAIVAMVQKLKDGRRPLLEILVIVVYVLFAVFAVLLDRFGVVYFEVDNFLVIS